MFDQLLVERIYTKSLSTYNYFLGIWLHFHSKMLQLIHTLHINYWKYATSMLSSKMYSQVVTCILFSSLYVSALNLSPGQETAIGSIPGACPKNFTYITNLNNVKMQGAFYLQLAPTNGKSLGCQGCWTTYCARVNNDSNSITLCCQKNNEPYCGEDVGAFRVVFDDSTHGTGHFVGPTYSYPGFHLAYEYGKMVVAFYCMDHGNGDVDSGVFALSSEPHASQSFWKTTWKLLKDNKIEHLTYEIIEQPSNCKYSFGCRRGCRKRY